MKKLILICAFSFAIFSCKEKEKAAEPAPSPTTTQTEKPSMVLPSIPSITVQSMEGKPLDLTSYKGKFVFVDFWAYWCGPCRNENPNLKLLVEEMKNKNIQFISVSVDPNIEKWKKAVAEDQMTWQQAIVSEDKNAELIQNTFQIQGIPHGALISPDGKLLANEIRSAEEAKAAINTHVK